MDQTYAFRATEPGPRLTVQIESRARDDAAAEESAPAAKDFEATLSLRRRELSRALLLRMLVRQPATSLQVVTRIYGQALRLRLKGARYFPHPRDGRPRGVVSP
jgi:hypothetical protein